MHRIGCNFKHYKIRPVEEGPVCKISHYTYEVNPFATDSMMAYVVNLSDVFSV